ncbi:MAG: hypothetical protein WDO16_12650 [Bacteroidota bacterium]
MKLSLIACLLLMAFVSGGQTVQPADTSSYVVKAKLLKKGYAPDCGIVSWGLGQKFEMVASSFDPAGKKIILIMTCPEMHGRDFFSEEKMYTIKIFRTRKIPVDAVVNDFKEENLPAFWISEINRE